VIDLSKYANTLGTAHRWGVSSDVVRRLLRDGLIPGAIKVGRDWLVPITAERHGAEPVVDRYGRIKEGGQT
jgi:hypothetical protein